MNLFAAAVTFAVIQPGAMPEFELPDGASAPLGYEAAWHDELEAARGGDLQAVLDLGHHEMDQGNLGRALAWFEFGTQLGDAHAQDHVVWLHPFLDEAQRRDSEAFAAEIVLELWDVRDPALGPLLLG